MKFGIKWIITLTILSITWINFNQERWKNKSVIGGDVICYNAYLPALFYQKDISLSFLNDTTLENKNAFYYPIRTLDGKIVIKTSMGMAISYLPFFTMAHIYSKLFHYKLDGFSEPYHFAILFSSLFYLVIGLTFVWKILRKYFDEFASSITLLCFVFGTNIFYYTTLAGGMSHIVGFSLIAAFIYYTIKWYEFQTIKTIILLGVIGGLLTLVRPVNILIFFFFFLYDIKSIKDIQVKLKLFLSYKFHMLILLVFCLLMILPQLIYWKYITGELFFNSYVGEQFYFNNSHVLKGLFGFRKGWLIYTPIMLFSILGIYFLRNQLKIYFASISITLFIYIFVIFSWWCWWYGGSFGQRAMIDIYPLLAIPFAAVIVSLKNKKPFIKKTFYCILLFLVTLNLFQSMQAKYNIIHYDSMTKESYLKVFFTTSKTADRENYLSHPNYEKAKRGEDEN